MTKEKKQPYADIPTKQQLETINQAAAEFREEMEERYGKVITPGLLFDFQKKENAGYVLNADFNFNVFDYMGERATIVDWLDQFKEQWNEQAINTCKAMFKDYFRYSMDRLVMHVVNTGLSSLISSHKQPITDVDGRVFDKGKLILRWDHIPDEVVLMNDKTWQALKAKFGDMPETDMLHAPDKPAMGEEKGNEKN